MSEMQGLGQQVAQVLEWLGARENDRLLALGDGRLGDLLRREHWVRVYHADLPEPDLTARWTLPYLATSFDRACVVDLLHPAHLTAALLAELNRVLVDDGLLVVPCQSAPQRSCFHSAGFEVEAAQEWIGSDLPSAPGLQYDGAELVRLRKVRRYSYHR